MAQVARRIAASAVVWLCAVSAGSAQTAGSTSTATVSGVVRGEMSRLLPEADVFLDSDSVGIRNDPSGRFRFFQVIEGQHWLFVRRIGYAPTRRLLTVVGGEDLTIDVRLEQLPMNLPEVEVRGRSGYRDFDHFMQATRNAWGFSVSEDQIQRFGSLGLSVIARTRLPWQATSWSDLARREMMDISMTTLSGAPYSYRRFGPPVFPVGPVDIDGYGQGWFGVTAPLTGSGRADRQSGGSSRQAGWTLGSGCAPAVSINGERVWSESRLDDIAPDLVASMEIYQPKSRGGHVPADFATDRQAVGCGLVVVWLR